MGGFAAALPALNPVAAVGMAAAGDVGGQFLGQRFALERQHQAQDFSAAQFATRYQTTVKDLKEAGLNPMLAYQQGGGSPPSGSVAGAQASSIGSSMVQARVASAQEANINADTVKKDQETATNRAIELKTIADTPGQGQIQNLLNEQIALTRNNAVQSQNLSDQIQMAIKKIDEEIKNVKASTQNVQADTELIALRGILTVAQSKLTGNQVHISDPKAEAAKSFSGTAAAQAENVSSILQPVYDLIDVIQGVRNRNVPKKVQYKEWR